MMKELESEAGNDSVMKGGLAADRIIESNEQLVLVSNIPGNLRSSDLRAFFSEFVEASRFRCFHFQHRKDPTVEGDFSSSRMEPRLCIVKLGKKDAEAFIRKYDGQHWLKRRRGLV